MEKEYTVKLWEDKVEKDETGKIIHHPLNSRYYRIWGQDIESYGHLTFGGHDLDKSSLLDDIRVFYLEFHLNPANTPAVKLPKVLKTEAASKESHRKPSVLFQ